MSVGGPAEHHNCMLSLWRQPSTNESFHPGLCPSVYCVEQPHQTSSQFITIRSKLNSDTDKFKPQGNKKILPARLSVRPLQWYYTMKHKDTLVSQVFETKAAAVPPSTCSLTTRGIKMGLLERCSVHFHSLPVKCCDNNNTKDNNHSHKNRKNIGFPS